MRLLTRWFGRKESSAADLAKILAAPENRESFLGVKNPRIPSPEDIKNDSARLVRYSDSSDYKVVAEETWARVLQHLDIILDDRTSDERAQYHRGALKATLDLLKLSYQARSVLEEANRFEQDGTLPR